MAYTEQDLMALLARLPGMQQNNLGAQLAKYPDYRTVLDPITVQSGFENMSNETKQALGLLPPSTGTAGQGGGAAGGAGGAGGAAGSRQGQAAVPAGIGSEPSAGGGGAGENPYAGGGFLSAGYPQEYGPLPENISNIFGLLGLIPYAGTPFAALYGMSKLAEWAGAERGRTSLADLSPQAANVLLSQVRAYEGDYKARDLEAAIADARSQQMNRPAWDPYQEPEAPSAGAPPSPGPEFTPAMEQPGAVTSPPPDYAREAALAELAGMGQPGDIFGGVRGGGWDSGTSSEGFGGGGPEGPGSVGGAGFGDMGNWARGGVTKATRGPQRATFGEAGPETAVFVPEGMKRPGIQGRERQVVQAMRALLQALQPRAGRRA